MKRTSLQLLSIVILCSFILTGCQYQNNNEETKQQRNYLSEVKSVNKLLLAQMTISKMATIDDIDLAKAEGMKLKGLTGKTVIVSDPTPQGTM